ncbi:MAG: Lrp/AsnC family transcriptional regulator [Nitrososphaerota archaeon]|nr:Lrp/AsnC family transcriptional regulator [Nitrososphaerota archaeon]MDG6927164.1 Lrp/AsnC family transcriptional regulator [Nitrososphaerota archaeon]MDG6931152.1 Lrp/AsnC family transcriptional regulator [Nitrososphaerota archaeon]MDG6932292.1 Lrp/AsnC family transcriptional regulator [Nitrososphaerota archaeon]MDG6936468.1 Lrp/AsnC family transcriptional regulator [Nitrososphaerota archaeon]
MSLDQMDYKIIGALTEDSRKPLRELANELGIPFSTLYSKIKRLENMKIITKYVAVCDYSRLGYALTAITEITVSKGKLVEIEKKVAVMNNVISVYDVTGESDIMIVTKFRTPEELSAFTKKLLSLEYVERTYTHVVLNIIKEDLKMNI